MAVVNDDIVAYCIKAGFDAAPQLGEYVGRSPAVDIFTRAALEAYIDSVTDELERVFANYRLKHLDLANQMLAPRLIELPDDAA